MNTYILIHGAWGGAWEFEDVIKQLSADGSRVIAPDLPGHGNNLAPISEVTMASYVKTVTDLINSLDTKVVLIGHSLAGFVISQVAENIPDKIERLIYVAALLPQNGETALGILENDEGSQLLANSIFSEDQTFATIKAEDMARIFFHDVKDPAVVQQAVAGNSIKQATEPFMAPIQLSQRKFGTVPKYYIRATQDRVASIALQNQMISNWKVEQVFTLESGHFPLTSMADQLTDRIQQTGSVLV